MAGRGRRAAREAKMRAVLEKWERSGVPLSRFAEREGVAQKTLYRWRRRLGVGDTQVRRGRPPVGRAGDGDRHTSPAAALFTEVSPTRRHAAAATMFEVVLGDGTMVRMPEHFDPGALRLLLATLRRC